MKDDRQMILLLAVATMPAVVAAVVMGDQFKAVYDMPHITALLLLVTAFLLLLPKLLKLGGDREIGFVSALVMGVGQALAILPGISRSGATITAGLLAKVNPAKAAEFSFLMSIPAIAGGAVFEFKTLLEAGSDAQRLGPLLVATVIAFVSGLAAIYTVLAAIRKGRFAWFSLYLVVAGISGFLYFRI
jgi:undecaprenyl-diphosphatase